MVLPLDEAISKAINITNRTWEDMYHRYYLLPKLEKRI
jgi:hypothetical protein